MSEIAVITGAGSGIGKALSEYYLGRGVKVAALDVKREGLDRLVDEWGEAKVRPFEVDVASERAVSAVAERIGKDLGTPSLWVNNAGITVLGSFQSIPSDAFSRVMSVCFDGVVFGTRAALGLMHSPARGTIVNIASVSGFIPSPFLSAYSSAKHAVVGFTRALQAEMELAESAVRFLLVCPGFIRTPLLTSQEVALPAWAQKWIDTPERVALEIARAVESGKNEITPTLNGKVMAGLYRHFPGLHRRSASLLLGKNWKEALGLSPIERPKTDDERIKR